MQLSRLQVGIRIVTVIITGYISMSTIKKCMPSLTYAAISEIVDIVHRLLVAHAREVYELELWSDVQSGDVFFNAPSFAHLVEQCQNLKVLTLEQIALDGDHCHVLGDISKPGLEIVLNRCEITVAAAAVLAQVLGRNQGPTKINQCKIDYSVIANGLRRNSRLKSLKTKLYENQDVGNREVLAIADALRENKGLVYLDILHDYSVSDEPWDAVCDSLKTHPTLEVLVVRRGAVMFAECAMAAAVIKSRIQALVDMMKVNTSIHTIHLNWCDRYSEHEFFRGSVTPYLETNMLRSRVRSIQKARPIAYRAKVLGRALLSTRTNANSFWMLLSGNAEVAFPPTTATTIPAANLPTPTSTAAATSNAATVTVSAPRVASAISASAATHVATPTADRKRRANP
jgi:hypothetical protein